MTNAKKTIILLLLLFISQNADASCKNNYKSMLETLQNTIKFEQNDTNCSALLFLGKVLKPDSELVASQEIDLKGFKLEYSELPCIFVTISKQLYGRHLGDTVAVFTSQEWNTQFIYGAQYIFCGKAEWGKGIKPEKFILINDCGVSVLRIKNKRVVGKFYPEQTPIKSKSLKIEIIKQLIDSLYVKYK